MSGIAVMLKNKSATGHDLLTATHIVEIQDFIT